MAKPRPRFCRNQGTMVKKCKRSQENIESTSGHTYIEDGPLSLFLSLFRIGVVVTAATLPILHLIHKDEDSYDVGLKTHLDKRASLATQDISLFDGFAMDYNEILHKREINMKKYLYNYSQYGVDKRSGLSLEEFWNVYDGKWPVILTDVVSSWPAFNWTQDFFYNNYGEEQVAMKVVDRDLDAAIFDVLAPFRDSFAPTITFGTHNILESAVSLTLPLELFPDNAEYAQPHRWTYLVDELFLILRPELKRDIGDCMYMDEDYFQLFPEEVRPWNAMLLWGTQYSRSSLHIDPYNWTGTNAVIKGRKRWKLYPPGQDHLLSVEQGGMSGFPLNCYKYNSPIDAFDVDLESYPHFHKAQVIEVDQLPGEMLIIPTGWFHQAFNVEETIAISSQVMNHNNYHIVLEEILKAGPIDRQMLPVDIDSRTPSEQVNTIMKLLSTDILQQGRGVTERIVNQIKKFPKTEYSQVPP